MAEATPPLKPISLCDDANVRLTFPFEIPTSILESNPKFAALFSEIAACLSSSGCSLKLEKELEKSKVEMRFAKTQYLKNVLLYQELENLSSDYSTAPKDKFDEVDSIVLERASNLLPLVETVVSLQSLTKNEPFLEFNRESVQKLNPQEEFSFIKQLMVMVKSKLSEFCNTLLKYYNMDDGNDPMDIAELPAKLVTDVESIEKLARILKLERSTREWHFTQYEKALVDTIDISQELLTKFRIGGTTELNAKLAQYLCLKGKALSKKIELLRMEILNDTYTKETVPALQIVSECLKESLADKEKTLTELTRTLNTYRSLGEDFDKLLVEYNGLKDTMENKKWALNKLKRS